MIDSISSGGFTPPPQLARSLSDEQSSAVSSILENYDADNLSADDAKDIASQLKDAGIQPGKGLADAMAQNGFDAREVGKLAGIEPPQFARSLSDEQSSTVSSILENFDAENLSAADAKDIAVQLKDAGIKPGKGLADVMAQNGFDAKEVAKLAGVEPPPPPAEQQESGGQSGGTISILV